MHITAIPCLKDNYAYLVRAPQASRALVVDPSESAPVLQVAAELGVTLEAVLCTHHHADHTGGNAGLRQHFPELRVYGYETDRGRIAEQTDFLQDETEIEVAGLRFRILHIPGHTLGAIAYVGEGNAFTGDTLFLAGCGRLFEGTPRQMYESLNVKLGRLPDETQIYCGHEYTLANLRFAAHIEAHNPDITEKAERARQLRERGLPTVPGTLGEERKTNPFLRCHLPDVQHAVRDRIGPHTSTDAVFAAVRAAKDTFS
jgi:hydroxyacylglutathione hydrolase